VNQPTVVSFYAENTALSEEKRWFNRTISKLVQQRRLEQAGIDPLTVRQSEAITVQGRGLFQRDAEGKAQKGETRHELLAIFLPMGIMMFMFMVIMMSSQPMLQTVLEEKTNRVAEVLLGSATPVQIMTGKLVGNIIGSLTVAAVYLVGGYALAVYNDVTDVVPMDMLPWLLLFLVLAIIMFSSMFMAIGASVNELKEAQNLLLPLWLLVCLPLFVWLAIVKEPLSSFATWFSLTPPFIPMLMCLRLASSDAVPFWQPMVGLLLMILTTAVAVFAASRIFRIGMLTQGQAPKMSDLIHWAVRG
jgi:ABC-2 type transport system permease protein